MIDKLVSTPKVLYLAIIIILAMLFFIFYSFGINAEMVESSYNSMVFVVDRNASIDSLSKQVTEIKTATDTSVMTNSVSEIIDMSESEIWKLVTNNKAENKTEANNMSSSECASLQTDITVPVWKWEDSTKSKKIAETANIKVNKYLAEYWIQFMTDLYNLPEKYVIESFGSTYSYRTKRNGSGTNSLSSHSWGTAIDINPLVNGMSSYSQADALGVPSSYGIPWKTQSGLDEPLLSTCCTQNSDWYLLAKKYNLDWGGSWSLSYIDPMHFSIVGDNGKDGREYSMQYVGRIP